ncbi:MAG: dephospho-CoA kinase [Candidatus Omnitrophota bacterium]
MNKAKLVLGITGSFGSGKSTVAGLFASCQAKIIDADKIAHSVIKRGSRAYKRIYFVFGKEILGKNKEIDRKRLAAVAFRNKKSIKELNFIVHPEVIRIIKLKIKNIKSGTVVLDAPLLIEAGLKKLVDKLIVVKITRGVQIRRIQSKTHLSRSQILERIKYQISLSKKVGLADFIIDNSGSLEKTEKQVENLIRRLLWKK